MENHNSTRTAFRRPDDGRNGPPVLLISLSIERR